MSPTTHLRCVRVFALLKESLQVKKDPLNSALRKCIYKTLHLLARLKVTFPPLPSNMADYERMYTKSSKISKSWLQLKT